MNERDSLLLSSQHQSHVAINCWRNHLCIPSKAGTLIILWTVLFGFVYTAICVTAAVITLNNHSHSLVDSVVTYPTSIMYTALAIVAMFYPLIGFLADVSCGRFRVVIFCYSLVLFASLVLYICVVSYLIRAEYYHLWRVHPAISAVGCTVILASLIGLGGYQANFIQFGFDQLLSAPSENLALFVHWAMWAYNLGSTIVATIWPSFACSGINTTTRIVIASLPFFLIAFFVLLLVISCWKRHWFSTELRQQNPCRMILRILNFARKYKYALRRSAYTYSDDDRPSRLDFAKQKFGGPFTTEQVEDTKAFFKVLTVLLALGPIFTMDVPSSYMGFMLFGLHTGSVHYISVGPIGGFVNCTSWVLLRSGSLKYIAGTLVFPVYMWVTFSCLRKRIPRMFVRLLAGIIVYMLGNLCLIITDLIGHMNFKQTSTDASLCMLDFDEVSSPTLQMHWTAMLIPSILLGVGPLIVMTTALEFISAQSPHFMKGLIVGLFFAIVGLFQLISAVALIPFSVESIWSTVAMRRNPPITNCGFGYLLFTFTAALIGLVLFAVVAKKYTYRERDDKPYDQSQVEEIFSRNLEGPAHGYI